MDSESRRKVRITDDRHSILIPIVLGNTVLASERKGEGKGVSLTSFTFDTSTFPPSSAQRSTMTEPERIASTCAFRMRRGEGLPGGQEKEGVIGRVRASEKEDGEEEGGREGVKEGGKQEGRDGGRRRKEGYPSAWRRL